MNHIFELATLILLFCSAGLGGWLAERFRLPALVGMLAAGLALRNAPGDVLAALPDGWSVALRLFALTIILLRAGLGLDLAALRRLRASFLGLGCLPVLAEATAVALLAGLLLGMPPAWALLLGFVVAAVSPAVVVPGILNLASRGFGVSKGIPTLILAAASLDDVLAIAGFGLTVSLIFGGGADDVAFSLVRVPLELMFGLGCGLVVGMAVAAAPTGRTGLRGVALVALGFGSMAAGWTLGFTGGASLAVMTMAAVLARSSVPSAASAARQLARVWTVAQLALFGLIGAAVSLDVVESSYIVSGLMILTVGLTVRLAAAYVAVGGAVFSRSERLFMAVAWIPKATVQAAIGALALDLALQQDSGSAAITYGTQVLTIAVLAIIVSAPIGATAIAWAGPRWLAKQDQPQRRQPG